MATRSSIAILRADGTVSQLYSHWDGYLSHNGQLLYLHYQDPQKVEKLITLGSISSLGKEVDIPPGVKHSYDNKVEDITVFYGRDRGEKDVAAQHFASFEEYKKSDNFQGYDYLFKEQNSTWYVYNQSTERLNKLYTALMKDPESAEILNRVKIEKEQKMLVEKIELTDKPKRSVPSKV